MVSWLTSLQVPAPVLAGSRAAAVMVAGVAVGWLLGRMVRRLGRRRFTPSQTEVAARLLFWLVVGGAVVSALGELGFDLTVLLGAAGVLTVAIGFASQTSASNLISGLFLLFERPYTVGDVIRIGGTTGEVVSIDLLSVRLRTFDNLLVRVPNETVLKAELTNLTHFPIRRFDLMVSVAYRHDLRKVRDLLVATADANPFVLDEPRPVVHFTQFGASSVDFQFSVWAPQGSYLKVKNDLPLDVHRAFGEAGIEIPFPQRVVQGLPRS